MFLPSGPARPSEASAPSQRVLEGYPSGTAAGTLRSNKELTSPFASADSHVQLQLTMMERRVLGMSDAKRFEPVGHRSDSRVPTSIMKRLKFFLLLLSVFLLE